MIFKTRVRRAHQRAPVPWNQKQMPAVRRHQGDGPIIDHPTHHQMNSFAAQQRAIDPTEQLIVQVIRPGAAGVDHAARLHDDALTAQFIEQTSAVVCTAVFDRRAAQVVAGQGAVADGIEQHLHGEAFRIQIGIVIVEKGAAQSIGAQPGFQGQRIGARHPACAGQLEAVFEAAIAIEGKQVIYAEGGLQSQRAMAVATINGQQKTLRADCMRGDPGKQASFTQRLADQADLPVLQIAKAAMNQTRGGLGGAGGEVAFLDERCGKASAGRIAGDAGPGNPAPNYKQVEDLAPKGRQTAAIAVGTELLSDA